MLRITFSKVIAALFLCVFAHGASAQNQYNISPVITITIPGSGIVQPVEYETPNGIIDGINSTFTLSKIPIPPTSLQLFLNGVLLVSITNYTLSGNSINYVSAPQIGDFHYALYRY